MTVDAIDCSSASFVDYDVNSCSLHSDWKSIHLILSFFPDNYANWKWPTVVKIHVFCFLLLFPVVFLCVWSFSARNTSLEMEAVSVGHLLPFSCTWLLVETRTLAWPLSVSLRGSTWYSHRKTECSPLGGFDHFLSDKCLFSWVVLWTWAAWTPRTPPFQFAALSCPSLL